MIFEENERNTAAEKLRQMISDSKNIVFFGGAGVSTESGIPDFRSEDGLYNQEYKYPPETILSRTFFDRHTEEFFRFYRDRMLYLDAEPNAAHMALAKLEQAGKLSGVITQNIDGLHQKAGSWHVIELHGSVLRNYCMECGKEFSAEYILKSEGIPRCDVCGGIVKPDVVLYQENLDFDAMVEARRLIRNADMLIVAGTSLAVYPAAGLIDYFTGEYLVALNKSATKLDEYIDLVYHGSVSILADAVQ